MFIMFCVNVLKVEIAIKEARKHQHCSRVTYIPSIHTTVKKLLNRVMNTFIFS